jgi:hypothetical protein
MTLITKKDHPEVFAQLCEQAGIEYPSTVHHFEQNVHGIYSPVLWGDVPESRSPVAEWKKLP